MDSKRRAPASLTSGQTNTKMNALSKVKFDDRATAQFQENVSSALLSIAQIPIVPGNLLQWQFREENGQNGFYEGLKLVPGLNYINHKLNRTLVGWLVTRKRSQANIWDSQNLLSTNVKNAENTKYSANDTLILNSDVEVVVDLWVF